MNSNNSSDSSNINSNGGSIYSGNTSSARAESEFNHVNEGVILVPLDEEVLLPYLSIATNIEHPDSILCAKKAYASRQPAFFFLAPANLPDESEFIDAADVVGCSGAFGRITEIEDGPNNSINLGIELLDEGILLSLESRMPYLKGEVALKQVEKIQPSDEEKNLGERLDETYNRVSTHLPEDDRKKLMDMLNALAQDSVRRLHFMIQNSPLNYETRYSLLAETSYKQRRAHLLEYLELELERFAYRMEIHQKTVTEIASRQKEDFLRTQMQQIRRELGDSEDDDFAELEQRAITKEWDENAFKKYRKEFKKLQRFNPSSPDYAVQYTYLDTYLSLPWNKCDDSEIDIARVEEVLNRDHFGLDKVKERIIEQMAVLKLKKDSKAPILCLYGPPGVGKTSLGKSVAEALGRKYARVALGGVHDEAEIRGHRRTYLGSMPGRIISALEKCGSNNPVIVLDEIDKLGADFKGDPSTALLEVLDPEQNCKFHDNYIDHDYDLSKVLFIATANSLSPVSRPLLDRMELVEIGGYVEDEKVEIALRHLLPRNLVEMGFKEDEVKFSTDALRLIIESYTHESGVRRLEKRIQQILRKLARKKASGNSLPAIIESSDVVEFLGKPDYDPSKYDNNDTPGVVTGLAWTQLGGEILFIESSVTKGKEGKLTLTGNLGDVMKESAMIALQFVKANAEEIGIPQENLEFGTIHIHVPEGAVPKDGPSAGITMATSIASTLSGRKVRSHLAMTGEITLRGKVLPVGGIKEKILAAKRAGIHTIMLCEKNRKDVEEIKSEYISGLDFHYVEYVSDALNYALLPL